MKKVLLMMVGLGLMGVQAGKLKDLVENASIDGYARVKYTVTGGPDGRGRGYQIFFKPNFTSGEVNGYSFTTGIFFAAGSSAPQSNTSDDFIGSSRSFRYNNQLDFFNISNLFVNKKFDKAKTDVRLGVMQINSPLNFTTIYGDRGIGVALENRSIQAMDFRIAIYDSWMTDNLMLQTATRAFGLDTNPNGKNDGFKGIGNNLVIAGWAGSFDSVGVSNLRGTFYYAYANKLFDAMVFADVGYTFDFGDFKLDLMGQIGYLQMYENPHFFSKAGALKDYFTTKMSALGKGVTYARDRGAYNLRMAFKYKGYLGDIGYMGSFGQGYGVMLDNKGGFKYGGQLWNQIIAGGVLGFGWTGTGGFRDTDIILAYTTHSYQINKVRVGIDFAFVGGHNRMAFMLSASPKIAGTPGDRGGAVVGKPNNLTKNINVYEISPQILYQATKDFSVGFVLSQLLGGMEITRGQVTFLYNF
ncbi:OprD family porin [Helicobacter mustelae]|uniref:Putative outer membrane protein n=1 Tax=Helicobacter mustelae (strain ATCC 43772 / CCUG 25715 / CIP 103759 / LMG 18044 / NCTC 12198 / R85-136P) TaxID=679897 RepID=D3UG90_HELM1|nr:hypothetical protein [Helicobacter mustelae]CBG39511.1 Putative outer membrane protein [Helicobacter mustelae 12198]SQH71022.1 outer membrane protein [Helicobacter mustelae]